MSPMQKVWKALIHACMHEGIWAAIHCLNFISVFFIKILVYYHYSLQVFHTSVSWWSFTEVWVTATLLKSLGLCSVFWRLLTMLKAHPLISISFNPFTKPLWIIPSTPITIGITIIFRFHSFFSSLAKSKYLSLFSFSLIFTLWSADSKVHYVAGSLFFC